jgi:hypothetical protein
MKAFNQFLVDLNDGTTHAGLTADLQELFTQVQQTGYIAILREKSGYQVLLGTP